MLYVPLETHTGRITEVGSHRGGAGGGGGATVAAADVPAGPSVRRRWVPPSSLRNHRHVDITSTAAAAATDPAHDVTFRKVRGILNKLTPEKFTKLGDDLLALQLDSDKVLKGVILLIFEKALDEPKYSSMYAQLCKRLSEQAPNLEPPGQPCTFRLLLLNKCRAEFENRAQAFASFDGRALTPDEEERRHLAKCKMLGNIKFIGELGKLEILAESILHRCIQQLLARRPGADHHEDLECLAQLVRTCGRVLDSARGRGLMDQYFARIDALAGARELAPRIRFMLRDVGELRRSGWVPRQASAAAAEGPVPIHQLRHDDDARPSRHHAANERQDALFRARRPLDDVLAGLALQPSQLQQPSNDKLFGNGFGRDAFRQRSAVGGGGGYFQRSGAGGGGYNNAPQTNGRDRNSGGVRRDDNNTGRIGRARVPAAPAALADVQMRPDPSSLVFTATRLSREPPPSAMQPMSHTVLAPAAFTVAPLVKEPTLNINIKTAPDNKNKPKKDKGMSKEEVCKLVVECVERAASEGGGEGSWEGEGEAVKRLLELQLPDKLLRRAVTAALEHALADPVAPVPAVATAPADADAVAEQTPDETPQPPPDCAAAAINVVKAIKRAPVTDAVRALLQHEPVSARVPRVLAHAVVARLCTLQEVGAWCEPVTLHATMLSTLQELHALLGAEALLQLYDESKLNAAAYVEGGQGLGGAPDAAGALDALEARGLGALVPQLRVQAALARQLAAEPAPLELFRWIKANVDAAVRGNAAFVSTLVALIARHVTATAGSGGGAQLDKAALEREKALVEGWAPLLTRLLEGRGDLQLAAVYAAHTHAHHLRYPKGMLLRWFMYLYNLEVCEEDAFLRWREDVTDAYPGKQEALFQVNAWLTWLQQQESEDEDAED